MLYFEHRKAGAVMKYRNARDIFPEALLRQIQRYVSGETVYIPRPDGSSKRPWGETSGYQQFIHECNAEIRSNFSGGKSIEELAETYCLSYDTIRKIVYSRKEMLMLKYSASLSSAREYAKAEKLDSWIHLYLNEDGRNITFSDGLKLFDRYYLSPVQMPLSLFRRCAGPEPEMKYRIHPEWFAKKVADLEKAIQNNFDDIQKLFSDSENGIMKKFSAALDSGIGSTGKDKGSLIRKAGLATGSSATDNEIYNAIKRTKTRITSLNTRYENEQNRLWKKYSAMEAMLGDLNSQQSSFSSYFMQ